MLSAYVKHEGLACPASWPTAGACSLDAERSDFLYHVCTYKVTQRFLELRAVPFAVEKFVSEFAQLFLFFVCENRSSSRRHCPSIVAKLLPNFQIDRIHNLAQVDQLCWPSS